MTTNQYKTPIADALLTLKKETLHSFHALPIFNGKSIEFSEISSKYASLFGPNLMDTELTTTGKLFDSFFFPNSVIRESEDLSAKLFGADGTLYITTGTTTSNQIAATALYQRTGPILIDKNCHQSIHFIFDTLGAKVDYIKPEFHCEQSECHAWNIDSLLATVDSAEESNHSYEIIVLTAQSYEGVIYNIPKTIKQLLQLGVKTRKFLIDEAWGAANYFNNELKDITAMSIDSLIKEYPDLEVVCTQSSHKSLSTLRQASMIHFRGNNELRERLDNAKFRIHCTSPSYPILASLDLARAQMEQEGNVRVTHALHLATKFKEQLTSSLNWSCYSLCVMPNMGKMNHFVKQDPCKVSINIDALGISSTEVQSYLYKRHGIYVNRITKNTILLNFHIGINQDAVEAILKGLAELQKQQTFKIINKTISDKFIIPYPPGVPLVVPGEEITEEIWLSGFGCV